MKILSKGEKGHVIDIVFALTLFCVFAVSLLAVVILGADIYGTTVEKMSENYELRTSLGYIAGKIKQNDNSAGIEATTFGGENAIALHQNINGTEFITYIYYYQGSLCEMFIAEGVDASPQAGQKIVDIKAFSAEKIADNAFSISCTDSSGKSASQIISIRSK